MLGAAFFGCHAMEFLASLKLFLYGYFYGMLYVFGFTAIFLIIERVIPAQRGQPTRDLWFNVRYYVGAQVINLLITPALAGLVIVSLRSRYPEAFGVIAEAGVGSVVLFTLLYYFVFDLFYYSFHRLQHVWPLLWREHLLHHSDVSLNATTTLRQHWLEEPLKVFFMALPLAVLFASQPQLSGIILVVVQLWTFYIHANIRLPLGVIGRFIAGPQFHRIHHSYLPEHIDRNYAVFFPIIDWMFGTYVHPKPGEYPPTGLAGGGRVDSILGAHLSPFKPPRKQDTP